MPYPTEATVPSPVTEGYRSKCEFTVGQSPDGKVSEALPFDGVVRPFSSHAAPLTQRTLRGFHQSNTVGFQLGSFTTGVMTIVEPTKALIVPPHVIDIMAVLQECLRQSPLTHFDRAAHTGFFRQVVARSTVKNETMALLQVHRRMGLQCGVGRHDAQVAEDTLTPPSAIPGVRPRR